MNANGSRTIDRGTGDTILEPEKEDWLWTIEIEEYGNLRRMYNKRLAAWNKNKGKAYHIVTTHCPIKV